MDLICYFIFAVVCLYTGRETIKVDVVERETKLNPEFYRDPDAFMKYIHAIFD